MNKMELVEKVKSSQGLAIAAWRDWKGGCDIAVAVRGGADKIPPLLGAVLHAYTMSAELTETLRDELGETEAKTRYNGMMTDAIQSITMAVRLRLAASADSLAPREAANMDDVLDAIATANEGIYLFVADGVSDSAVSNFRATRPQLLDMITEVMWQCALHSTPKSAQAMMEIITSMLAGMRAYMDARYIRAMSMDRDRRRKEATPPATDDAAE